MRGVKWKRYNSRIAEVIPRQRSKLGCRKFGKIDVGVVAYRYSICGGAQGAHCRSPTLTHSRKQAIKVCSAGMYCTVLWAALYQYRASAVSSLHIRSHKAEAGERYSSTVDEQHGRSFELPLSVLRGRSFTGTHPPTPQPASP